MEEDEERSQYKGRTPIVKGEIVLFGKNFSDIVSQSLVCVVDFFGDDFLVCVDEFLERATVRPTMVLIPSQDFFFCPCDYCFPPDLAR